MKSIVLALGLALGLPAFAASDSRDHSITVMTRNVYHGVNAELNALVGARGFADLVQKVARVYDGYFLQDFAQRAEALAAEIDETRPALIGLQEAVLVRTQAPADAGATAASKVALDYVDMLQKALAARGLRYEVVAESMGFDAELPSAYGFDVRHTDREIILANADMRGADLQLSNSRSGHYAVNCTIPSASIGPVTIRRGWVSVDARFKGREFRFVSTHLDGDCLPFTPAIQQAQAKELLADLAASDLPVILAGDLNSPADGSGVTYGQVMASGFADAAAIAGLAKSMTCCQDPAIRNTASLLDTRIDLILFRGEFEVRAAAMVGNEPSDRTPGGLWPSDHAGVVATLAIPR